MRVLRDNICSLLVVQVLIKVPCPQGVLPKKVHNAAKAVYPCGVDLEHR